MDRRVCATVLAATSTSYAESELLGNLSADEEVRIYNRRLALELKQYADRLRRQLNAAGKGG